MATTTDASTPLPSSDDLAFDRTRLAHDRTLMAWIRTATSLISFGFTIYKFFEYMHESGQATASNRAIGPRQYALLMISTGVLALAIATVQHYSYMRMLRRLTSKKVYSLATLPAALISALGVLALLAVVFRL
jgi:putative membrane protein